MRWDGVRQDVVMRLTVGGDAERVAWIMPVPRRATVRLGDPELFEELHDVTAPVHRDRRRFWPRDGDWPLVTGGDTARGPRPPRVGGPPVGVVGRRRLGPFDVTRLTATDPDPRTAWNRPPGSAANAPASPTPNASPATTYCAGPRRLRLRRRGPHGRLRRSAESTILEFPTGKGARDYIR
ncbi:hypothetical protein STVIR_6150 [Streptomyces viridochromogenes Tue57]|uniref:Uncharacterized protein n=1 Tax=Streptomyces viridochromogenes Tue57 TaxID=1160705 RepID=L8P928_STRVR|nr:hypothetical protein STVIR_6150 [Streptomyces viridochromogenes Tue57]